MPKQKLEIECPVCDAKMSIDARCCPKCGADLGMADFQDLEDLANDISGGAPCKKQPSEDQVKEQSEEPSEKSEETVATPTKEEPTPESMVPKPENEPSKTKENRKEDVEESDTGKKKGLFSKFFGKKK